jgi:hypothetical protein
LLKITRLDRSALNRSRESNRIPSPVVPVGRCRREGPRGSRFRSLGCVISFGVVVCRRGCVGSRSWRYRPCLPSPRVLPCPPPPALPPGLGGELASARRLALDLHLRSQRLSCPQLFSGLLVREAGVRGCEVRGEEIEAMPLYRTLRLAQGAPPCQRTYSCTCRCARSCNTGTRRAHALPRPSP